MQFELEAKKSLGQNFLKNTTIIKKMVDAAVDIAKTYTTQHKKDVTVLEIGPGTGALTQYLLETKLKVTAIETDDRAIPLLSEKFITQLEDETFTLIHEDIRNFDIYTLQKPYILVANIPYYLTGYIMRKFLESTHQPIAILVMVQKEVAQRILDPKQSLASIGVYTYGTPSILMHVSKGNFVPPPKVDSSILVVNNIHRGNFVNEAQAATYWEILKKAFGQKRKQLGATIFKTISEDKKEKLKNYITKRPEEISQKEWLEIIKIYGII